MTEIPKICRYCGNEVVLVHNSEIYGKSYGDGKCYLCRSCGAYVGTHKGTVRPLGSLANKELRNRRNEAHEWFDKLWKGPNKVMRRLDAYKWLSGKMDKPASQTHIGMFEIHECNKTIDLVQQFMVNNALSGGVNNDSIK